MLNNNKKILKLIKQLDPALVAKSLSGNSVSLVRLVELLAQQVIDHKQSNATLESQPPLDPLTQLPNRSYFNQCVEQAINRALRHKKPFALVFIDIDHFKAINDTHGHKVGDQLLQELAQRILQTIRKSDVLCRLAGDEFCVLVEELEQSDAILKVINAIRRKIGLPFDVDDLSLIVTCSIGVSVYPDDGQCFQDLLHFADLAMYEAKRSGRNSVSLFTPEIANKVRQLTSHQKRLKSALEFSQFEYWFQPELELSSGNICAVRQVATLPAPGLGCENSVLDVAQQGKKVTMLNIELIRAACEQFRRWESTLQYIPRIVIPLYKDLLCSPRCHCIVKDIINRFNICGSSIEFEVSELDLSNDCEHGVETVKQLHSMGCKISLINFGIGPASLRLLSSGHIYKIKIDNTLISDITQSKQSRQVMEAIIELCLKFNIRVVALDVTNLEQVNLLESLRCDGIRGEFLSPLFMEEEFTKVLTNYNSQQSVELDTFQEKKYRISGIPPQV